MLKTTIGLDEHDNVVSDLEDAAVIMIEEYDDDGLVLRSTIYRRVEEQLPSESRAAREHLNPKVTM